MKKLFGLIALLPVIALGATLSASELATLNKGGSITLTGPAVTPVNPPVTPPIAPPVTAPTGAGLIYSDGSFKWPGDWSGGITVNYNDTTGDASKDIAVKVTSAFGYWLPYCPEVGPTISGYTVPSCDLTPYTAITMQLKATVANQKWALSIFKYNVVNGALTDDTVVGQVLDLTPYGGAAVVNQWVTYTIPLSAMNAQGLKTMYKFLLQDQTGASGQTWYVNNVAFK